MPRPPPPSADPAPAGDSPARSAAVFGWLATGLGLAAGAAFGVVASPAAMAALVLEPGALFGACLAAVALALALWGRVEGWGPWSAGAALAALALLTGTATGGLFVAHVGSAIAPSFGVGAATFAAAAAWGRATGRALRGPRGFLALAALGAAAGTAIHGLLGSPLRDWGTTAAVVLALALVASRRPGAGAAAAPAGALAAYLDFVALVLVLPWIARRWGDGARSSRIRI